MWIVRVNLHRINQLQALSTQFARVQLPATANTRPIQSSLALIRSGFTDFGALSTSHATLAPTLLTQRTETIRSLRNHFHRGQS
jgi:hypothetical protein